jgi:ankyrin repeat protein
VADVEELVGNAHGNLARVKELVDANPALVDARAPWNETPIEAATQMGNRPIIEFLIERGAPIDIFTASVLGDLERVRRELVENPSLAEARGVHDLPTLYFAAIGGSLEVAELLLRSGAGVNDHAEAAALLHGAVMGGSADMVRWLLDHGADPALPDYKGRGARQLAEDMDRQDLAGLIDPSI